MTITLGQVQELDLKNIVIPPRLRAVKPGTVGAMMKSFAELGHHTPIVVRWNQEKNAWMIVTGVTRALAADKLGWPTIRAVAVECSDDEATLLEIEENLVRAGLTKAERAHHLLLRKEIWERQQAEHKPDGSQTKWRMDAPDGEKRGAGGTFAKGNAKPKGFAAAEAARTGKSKSQINRDIAAAKGKKITKPKQKPKKRAKKDERLIDPDAGGPPLPPPPTAARRALDRLVEIGCENPHGGTLSAAVFEFEIGHIRVNLEKTAKLISATLDALNKRFPADLYRKNGEKVEKVTTQH